MNFCSEYKKRFDLQFLCQTRIDKIDEEVLRALKEAGCTHISLAVESGNEEIRSKLLKKPCTDEQIVGAFKLAKKHGLRTQSFNMLGLPGEHKKYIFESIELNRKIQPDRILCSVFMPFKGTELGESCFKEGLVKGDVKKSSNYYNVISIKYDNISPRDILGYQGFYDWYIRLPKKYYKLIDLFRIVYQTLLTTQNPKNKLLRYFRSSLIEFVYQAKRFLPVSDKYHVTKR
ncbi:B12-binding domain-containing radical SAM protein [Candidatus Margulisiibacteriota bacterium]